MTDRGGKSVINGDERNIRDLGFVCYFSRNFGSKWFVLKRLVIPFGIQAKLAFSLNKKEVNP